MNYESLKLFFVALLDSVFTHLFKFVNILGISLGGPTGFSAHTLLLLRVCSIVPSLHCTSCERPFTKVLPESSVKQKHASCLPFQPSAQVLHILIRRPVLIAGAELPECIQIT